MEELRVSLEELKEALAEDKPAAYDADEVVAARMLEQDAAVQQRGISTALQDPTLEDLKKAEEVCLSWSLSSLLFVFTHSA
jgi:hypothetical protein